MYATGARSHIIYSVDLTYKHLLSKWKRATISCTKYPISHRQIHHHNTTGQATQETGLNVFSYLSETYPVHVCQELLTHCHDLTGLSWWATIVLSTITLRTCVTLPLALYQNYILAKVDNLTKEMPEIVKELKIETVMAMKQFNWTEKQARAAYNRSIKKQWNKLIVRDNCHPFKSSILLWVQLPMWICLSAALRNLVYMLPTGDMQAQIICAEMTVGGFAWIPNLTIPDGSYIFPVLLGLINLAIIEAQSLSRVGEAKRLQVYVTNFFRVFSIIMIPIATMVPSCLCLYWVTSSSFGLVQNFILLHPRVKRVFRIPQTSKELAQPYQHLWQQIKRKLIIS